MSGFVVKQFRASRTLGLQLSGAYCVVILSGNFCPQGKLGLQLSVMYIVSCFHCVEKPRETQRGPERPREARRGPERPREAQRGPEKPREPQRASEKRTERHREAQRDAQMERTPMPESADL